MRKIDIQREVGDADGKKVWDCVKQAKNRKTQKTGEIGVPY